MITIRILSPGGAVLYDARLDTMNATPGMMRRFLWTGLKALVEVHRKTPPALTTKLEVTVDRRSASWNEFTISDKPSSGPDWNG